MDQSIQSGFIMTLSREQKELIWQQHQVAVACTPAVFDLLLKDIERTVLSNQQLPNQQVERDFNSDIARMNKLYELPQVADNMPAILQRIQDFKSILMEECGEIDELFPNRDKTVNIFLEIRTNLADLLGDIVVYCTSEALRWDIPLPCVLQIIMDSNFSKLGEDGKPIKDNRGKFLKGPNYWKPEEKIKQVLIAHAGDSNV